jgi:hypothetical protein
MCRRNFRRGFEMRLGDATQDLCAVRGDEFRGDRFHLR